MTPSELTLILYNLTLFPVVFFSLLFITLALIHLIYARTHKPKYKSFKELPRITVQIPTFNDPIALRCIKKCLAFDYPQDKLDIIVADDSTNLETQQLLAQIAQEHDNITYVHRNNRQGFKPGALKEAMHLAKGEFIVIFDADWMPKKNFLKKIIQPFTDQNVALVQSRQGFYNKDQNLVTRFAAYTLMIYHAIVMPINHKINCVFFCGTAGALRKSAFEKVGGWNLHSITEDSDLSVKLLMNGYKTVYLDFETPSEVPDTIEAFAKQQMRWCYGNVRVFFDNLQNIFVKKGLSIRQRLMIIYILMGHAITPVIALMTILGLTGWFVGEPTLLTLADLYDFAAKFGLTIGFIILGTLMLIKYKALKEFPHLIATVFTVGIVLAYTNAYAFIKAVLNKPLGWYCTPKTDNSKLIK